MIPALLALIISFSFVAVSVVQITMDNFFVVGNTIKSQQAFNMAEAGINYYLWHLNHNNTDFKDGKTTPASPDPQLGYGPYVHDYIDTTGKKLGTFTLYIKPESTGSTIVTVRSIGKTAGSGMIRTVEAKIGQPSFASYGVVGDVALWFGNTESADGPVHSNVGIRMDGANSSTVSSSNATYTPPGSLGGDGSSKPGVWCHTSVTSPINCNTRNKSDWLYPTTAVDFNQISGSLCTIKKVAFFSDSATQALANQANACNLTPSNRTNAYLPRRSPTYNLTRGYLIELNSNNTYNLYQVNGENDQATPYTSALTRSLVQSNIPIDEGVIYAEDNVWVRSNPTFSGRLTIAAGRLSSGSSSTYANIVVADDIVYGSKNGADALGLISQKDVIIAPYAPPASGAFNFEIDAAMLSQTSRVWYPASYRTDSDNCTRGWVSANQNFLFYGSVGTRQSWTWTWLQGGSACGDAVFSAGNGYISGILNNSTQYDYNLRYNPPPYYPLIGGYNFISWREVLTRP